MLRPCEWPSGSALLALAFLRSNRQPARPAGRLILTTLASLRLIPATATTPAQITRPDTVQARLLELLGVDPARPP